MTVERLEKRIDRLETKFDDIYAVVKEMKQNLDDLIRITPSMRARTPIGGAKTTSTPRVISTPMAGTHEKGANPWALRSAQRLFSYSIGRQIIDSAFETYKPTIEALKSATNGLTANEVSEITGRARNTESSYLKKLQRAGFAIKRVKDGKAIYTLADEENLPVVFGNR